jgi:hypothetical protein
MKGDGSVSSPSAGIITVQWTSCTIGPKTSYTNASAMPVTLTQAMPNSNGGTFTIEFSNTFTGATASFSFVDAGGTVRALSGINGTNTGAAASGISNTSSTSVFMGNVPVGTQSVQVTVTAVGTGTLDVQIVVGVGSFVPVVNNSALLAGTARAQMNVSASKWIQQSTANLAAGATVTGSWVDCLNSTSGNVGGSTSYPGKYNPFGTCDKTCTLYVDQSPDASTAYHSDSFVGAIPTDGSNYVAKPPVGTAILPGIRYCRARLKNTSGATSTLLYLSDVQVAA